MKTCVLPRCISGISKRGKKGPFEPDDSSGTGTKGCDGAVDKFRLEKEEKHLGSGTVRAVKAKKIYAVLRWTAVKLERESLDILWQGPDTAMQERLLHAY